MRLICFWCLLVAIVRAQDSGYYAPQTFSQNVDTFSKGLFTPSRNDVAPEGTISEPWKSRGTYESWGGAGAQVGAPGPVPVYPKPEPWRLPYALTKEQQSAILHHKQSLTSDGGFRFEYASDNGVQAGEVIQPDGSRIGGYQYKDPSGQLVKLKYKAGKEGFQILEGSHIPKSPEPVPPLNQESHYKQAYEQQRQAYDLQQQYNQQRPDPNNWNQRQQTQEAGPGPAAGQYYNQNWRAGGQEDDGQYRENDVDNKGPHNFGEGYSFAFQG